MFPPLQSQSNNTLNNKLRGNLDKDPNVPNENSEISEGVTFEIGLCEDRVPTSSTCKRQHPLPKLSEHAGQTKHQALAKTNGCTLVFPKYWKFKHMRGTQHKWLTPLSACSEL
jgi:hypothetical protein